MTIASSIPASDDNSLNFALDDDTVGSRLNESANAHSGDDSVSPEGTKQDYHNNYGNGMSFCSSQMGDNIGNSPLLDRRSRDSPLLDRRSRDSASVTSWPLANVTVDSGLHEDTLEGQKPVVIGVGNYAADSASVLGNFEVDQTKSKEYFEDEDNCPRSSKTEEQNAEECKTINFTVDRLHEDTSESQKTIFGSPESHAEDMDLMLSTSAMDKTNNENVPCKSKNEKGTSLSKTKQEQIEMDEAKNVIISCESQDQKSPRASKTKQESNTTVDRRLHEDVLPRQKPFVGGQESHPKDKALMLGTSEMDKTKNGNISCKSQDKMRSRASKTNQEQIQMDEPKNVILCRESQDKKGPRSSKTKQEQIQMDEPKNVIISCDSQDKKGSRASKTKQDQNAQESKNINTTVDRRMHEDTLERQKHFVGGPESHVKDKALMLGTSEVHKNKINNISCKFQGKRRSRSSKTKQDQNETIASQDGNISCRSQDKMEPRASKTRQDQNETDKPKGENISCGSQDKKEQRASKTRQDQNKKDGPNGENISSESQDKKGPKASKTRQDQNETDEPKGENIFCESQDKKGPRASKTRQDQNKTDEPKGENISYESQDKKGPRASKTRQYLNETDGPKGENISYESQDKKGPRASKTGQEQNGLNVGHDITEKKYISISSHESERSLTHFGDSVVDRLDNSANEGNRDNNCPEDTELDKKKNSGHEIGIGSNKNVINPNSMGDEMDTSCSLGFRSKEISSVSKTSNASTTEDNELHEDTLVGQKPLVKGSESLVADKTVTELELVHNISDKVPEDRDLEIRKANTDLFLGNEVDSNASETQEMSNPPSASNQLDSNCSSTRGTLQEAREYRKATRESKNLGQGSKPNTPKEKTAGVLQPERVGKAFKEHNPEPNTPKAQTLKVEANTFKADRFKEKASITKTSQSTESTRPMTSGAVVKWCLVTLCLFIYPISSVQAPPLKELPELQQWWFCSDGDHLYNQPLVIKNLDRTEEVCSFVAPDVPYYHNCPKIKASVILTNKTCLEMYTTDHQTQQWIGEYGTSYNGKNLKTTRGELLRNEEVTDKVGQYTHDDGPQAGSHNQSTVTPGQANKPPDIPNWLLILLCTLAAIVPLSALAAYFICKRCANTDQSSTANGIELQPNGRDGRETSTSLLPNGISEH